MKTKNIIVGEDLTALKLGARLPDNNNVYGTYGMALHTATDAFAHSAYVNNVYIEHPNCDYVVSTTKGEQRYNSAAYVAKGLLNHIKNGKRGYVKDFVVPSSIHKN